jgi:lipoprotein-anchoring transpeptidase ErfK/SrfK
MKGSLLAGLALVVLAAVPAAGARAPQLPVYFTKGEQLTAIHRGGTTLTSALQALVAGPTAAERATGFTTEIPAGTKLRRVGISQHVASVDLTGRFQAGGGSASMFARLAELVYTATAVDGVDAVRLLLDGKPIVALGGEGLMVDKPVDRAYFGPKTIQPPVEAPTPKRASSLVASIQARLTALGYLPAGSNDGVLGIRTTNAIVAFQGWQGLPRTGAASQALLTKLRAAKRPLPPLRSGRRVEVSVAKQVALLVDGRGVVTRAIHVSTGKASTPTPRGAYTVFRKELRSWSVPFQEWLPYASYFNGGIALHEFGDVPTYAASHGCVRVPAPEAPVVYRFATVGTRVFVS